MGETAGAVSLKVLAERKVEGIQKVTNFAVDPRIIEIEDGFNARPIDPEHVRAMKMSMLAGSILPPLFVRTNKTIKEGVKRNLFRPAPGFENICEQCVDYKTPIESAPCGGCLNYAA